jgi:hypothetical protein
VGARSCRRAGSPRDAPRATSSSPRPRRRSSAAATPAYPCATPSVSDRPPGGGSTPPPAATRLLLLGRAAAERDAVPELRQPAHDRGRLGHGEHVVHPLLHLPPGAEEKRRAAHVHERARH